jgi:hypothetical protein
MQVEVTAATHKIGHVASLAVCTELRIEMAYVPFRFLVAMASIHRPGSVALPGHWRSHVSAGDAEP